uniref:Ribosomal protein L37A n=1 Tax=Lotharella vacuolata TaxID=74820 RepID=A0A0H5BHB8_9EUKA|nr:ribosomal protein L37A [Lotharella vacuolata]
MKKYSKKFNVSKKFGPRYGAALRRRFLIYERQKKIKYFCILCGENKIKRDKIGIWVCLSCKNAFSGGAFNLKSSSFKFLFE